MLRAAMMSIGFIASISGSFLLGQQFELDRQEAQARAARADLAVPLDTDRGASPGAPLVVNRDGSAPSPETHSSVSMGKRIGRLQIPAIGVDQAIVEGVGEESLAIGVGRYSSTARIGEAGAIAIAGHRTGWGSPLLRLDELKFGAKIIVTTERGKLIYQVRKRRIVEPSGVWVLDGNPRSRSERQLVITTCTPAYTAEDRLIIFADYHKGFPALAKQFPHFA